MAGQFNKPRFGLAAGEHKTVDLIAIRALEMQAKYERPARFQRSRMDFVMDIAAAHNAIPLDLERLLAADDFNFAHDVFGIERHLDRQTGEIGGCFLPRFATKQRQEAN